MTAESMNEVFFRDLGIRKPDRHLGTGSGTQLTGGSAETRLRPTSRA
jgi:hypothetical protein